MIIPALRIPFDTHKKQMLDAFFDAMKRENYQDLRAIMKASDTKLRNFLNTEALADANFPSNGSRALAFNPDPGPTYEDVIAGKAEQSNKYLTLGLLNDRPSGKCGADSCHGRIGLTQALNSYIAVSLDESEELQKLGKAVFGAPFLPKPELKPGQKEEEFGEWDWWWTSITVNADSTCAAHVDAGNLGPSFICSFGDFVGGEVWIADENGKEIIPIQNERALTSCKAQSRSLCHMKKDGSVDKVFKFTEDLKMGPNGVKYNPKNPNHRLGIRVNRHDIREKATKFDGRIVHATCPFFDRELGEEGNEEKLQEKLKKDLGWKEDVDVLCTKEMADNLQGDDEDNTGIVTGVGGIPYDKYNKAFLSKRYDTTRRFVCVFYPHRVFYRPYKETINTLITWGFERLGENYKESHAMAEKEFLSRRNHDKGVKMFLKTQKLALEQKMCKDQFLKEPDMRYSDVITLRDIMEEEGVAELARVAIAIKLAAAGSNENDENKNESKGTEKEKKKTRNNASLPFLWESQSKAGLIKEPQDLFEDMERTFHEWCRNYERRLVPALWLGDPLRNLAMIDHLVEKEKTESGSSSMSTKQEEDLYERVKEQVDKKTQELLANVITPKFSAEMNAIIKEDDCRPGLLAIIEGDEEEMMRQFDFALCGGGFAESKTVAMKTAPAKTAAAKKRTKKEGQETEELAERGRKKQKTFADFGFLAPVTSNASGSPKRRSTSQPNTPGSQAMKKTVELVERAAVASSSSSISPNAHSNTRNHSGKCAQYAEDKVSLEEVKKKMLCNLFGWNSAFMASKADRRTFRFWRWMDERGMLICYRTLIRKRYFSDDSKLPEIKGNKRQEGFSNLNSRVLKDGFEVFEKGEVTTQYNQSYRLHMENKHGNDVEDKEEGKAKKAREERINERNNKDGKEGKAYAESKQGIWFYLS